MSEDHPDLEAIEALAVELAGIAGAEITASLGRTLSVRYKALGGQPPDAYRDPVSDIDHSVEVLIRARLAELYPEHDIVGEEIDERPGRDHDVIWAVDPVDGTANFVNGFPLFAASIGVVHKGVPVVGALWCSTSHALRAGVYHARDGGSLCFEGEPIASRGNPSVMQRLVGLPRMQGHGVPGFDIRQTGSAAIECAFTAAGLLTAARFERPNIWDVAAGLALVRAAGGTVLTRGADAEDEDGDWTRFERFETAPPAHDIGIWRQPLIIGSKEAAEMLRSTA